MKTLFINNPTIKTILTCAKIELYTTPSYRLIIFTPYGEYYELTHSENEKISSLFSELLSKENASIKDVHVVHRFPLAN